MIEIKVTIAAPELSAAITALAGALSHTDLPAGKTLRWMPCLQAAEHVTHEDFVEATSGNLEALKKVSEKLLSHAAATMEPAPTSPEPAAAPAPAKAKKEKPPVAAPAPTPAATGPQGTQGPIGSIGVATTSPEEAPTPAAETPAADAPASVPNDRAALLTRIKDTARANFAKAGTNLTEARAAFANLRAKYGVTTVDELKDEQLEPFLAETEAL